MKRLSDPQTETEISEIFSSLQGEGPHLGVKQIFVRFGRCNMHCGYCDELEKMKEEHFQVFSADALTTELERLESEKGSHHSVALTGGDPLFYAPFLAEFLPRLKAKGRLVYLETNGTLPRELSEVVKWCDIIAMDMKPPTSTGDRPFWAAHEEFLKIAIRKEVFVKVVVTPETAADEVKRCAGIVKSVNPKIPFILQPVSDPFGINTQALSLIEKEILPSISEGLFDVRVIPQMHKIWGVR
ncbi:MAG: 7-carboxy-7-deazaguanine synthase QueE [Candidatus Omnitrophica bacterium]|nr:7-carboxy-7-deazaguanine synthase QueE [Candidatus Omnitrophota bacterium]